MTSDELIAARALKGKDFIPFDRNLVAPHAKPWRDLDPAQVRYLAITTPARLLAKGQRQAAAHDPKLEWDEATRSYRLRRKATPAPSPPKGGNAEREGGHEKSSVLHLADRRRPVTHSLTPNRDPNGPRARAKTGAST